MSVKYIQFPNNSFVFIPKIGWINLSIIEINFQEVKHLFTPTQMEMKNNVKLMQKLLIYVSLQFTALFSIDFSNLARKKFPFSRNELKKQHLKCAINHKIHID